MRRRRAALVLVLALVAALALPGGGSAHPGHQVAEVSVGQFRYQPAEINIVIGDGINWVFRGPETNHTITADPGQSETFDSDPGTTSPSHAIDDTFYNLFNTKGTFTYHCKVHPDMRGTIHVTDPTPPTILAANVRPTSFCTGRGCKKPKLKVTVDQAATMEGTLERRGKRWKEIRELGPTFLNAGENVLPLDAKGLDPAKYRAIVSARDAFGLTSAPENAEFQIEERRR
jgi:plastocyanin